MQHQINTFLELMRALQKIDPEFPIQYAICLAEISLKEGLCITELSQLTKMPLSTVSRIAGALSNDRQRGKPYELIEITLRKDERQKKQITLTPKGKSIINEISEIISA